MNAPDGAASFRVPRTRVAETHRRLAGPLRDAVDRILFGGPLAAADALEAFEGAFAAVMGRHFAVGVQSGTAGLFLALRAAGVGPGDEVVTVANSDISTVSAITHCGATPVFCDIRADDYTIDVDRVEGLITSRTRAVVPVDLYGHPADVRRLRTVVESRGLWVVEDACLAVGARDCGREVGDSAHLTVFSFNTSKPLGTSGNGGAVVTDDAELAARVRLLRGYGAAAAGPGAKGKQSFVAEGYNLPLEGLHAAVLGVKLPFLREWTRRRREVAEAYARALTGSEVSVPRFRAEAEPTFRQFTVRVPRRDAVYDQMRAEGVDVVLHYTPPMHRQAVYESQRLPGSDRLPVTEAVAEDLLCLPVSPELTDDDVAVVVSTLKDVTRRARSAGG